jgi:hypothetical protein
MNAVTTHVHSLYSHDTPVVASGSVHVTYGAFGHEKRNTTSQTGIDNELITVWSHASGACESNDRVVYGALSPDNGQTWRAPFLVGHTTSADLVNPFAVQTPSGSELRVYAIARGAPGASNLVVFRSTDHGRHWGPSETIDLPPGVQHVSRPVFTQYGSGLVCFTSYSDNQDNQYLATFAVP